MYCFLIRYALPFDYTNFIKDQIAKNENYCNWKRNGWL